MKYIWQHDSWPDFSWDLEKILKPLSLARKSQGFISSQEALFDLKGQGEVFLQEAVTTSAIEGENLDENILRSSIANRLGLPTAGLPPSSRKSDGLVGLLVDATTHYNKVLTAKRLEGWQAALFPTGYSGIYRIETGKWRTVDSPMRVVSGAMDREKIHFEAPPSNRMVLEMERFLSWWNMPPGDLDGIIRAAIAHFWFVTIHPFDDGNGRIARALADMALAQDEDNGKRIYSLSSQIIIKRNAYYEVLERTQKGEGDITEWIIWFLDTFIESISHSGTLIEKTLFISDYYKYIAEIVLNERQIKVLKKLLDRYPEGFTGGLTNRNYVSITGTSPETAKRDLNDLVLKKVVVKNEPKGRSTSYTLAHPVTE